MNNLIFQGAEAKVFLTDEIKSDSKIILAPQAFIRKSRVPKSYRHPKIDEELRKKRTRIEARVLSKALAAGANIPKVLRIEKYDLEMEFINGDRLSQTLNSYSESKQFSIMREIGTQTAILHNNNIIHGDLTTSNMILQENKIFLIDFGLGFISRKIEDKAVDVHLIKQALEAKHFQNHKKLFREFLEGYNPTEKEKILARLEAVEKRGRYRH